MVGADRANALSAWAYLGGSMLIASLAFSLVLLVSSERFATGLVTAGAWVIMSVGLFLNY